MLYLKDKECSSNKKHVENIKHDYPSVLSFGMVNLFHFFIKISDYNDHLIGFLNLTANLLEGIFKYKSQLMDLCLLIHMILHYSIIGLYAK